jgi:SAM-dependent methyltransferase
MYIKPLLLGLASYIPGLRQVYGAGCTGGTDSARYCYSVWLRHLVSASMSGLPTDVQVVAELGPGDSVGIGLAALISGSQKYYAFDIIPFAQTQRNLAVFDDLVELFRNRENIPGEDEFPEAKPLLESYNFPGHILTEARLQEALKPLRLQSLKAAIHEPGSEAITYKAPWFGSGLVLEGTVDLVFSQAVMEHVDDIAGTYRSIYAWLRPQGFMSHQIDFKSHGTSDEWNGHWCHSDFTWRLIRGIRPYFLNREPLSTHIRLMKEAGFTRVLDTKVKAASKYGVSKLAPRFRNMSEDDLTTSSALVQAVK